MQNMLLQEVEYKIEETQLGVWRRFAYTTGQYFEEFTSHKQIFGLPLIHYTRGKCPETGRRIVAKGIIAIGRFAVGFLAIGHASAGLIAFGQLALGLLLGLGQLSTGAGAIGQLAFGAAIGIGQIATGYVAIGQIGMGHYVLAQSGIGTHVWDAKGASEVAKEFFTNILP